MRRIWLSSTLAIALSACTTYPQPLTDIDGQQASAEWQSEINASRGSPIEDLTLYEAMARALKYNLDYRVSMMELDIARTDYELSHYNRLPNVTSNAGIYSRNNQQGSSSLSLLSGRQSLEPSTALERTYLTAGLTGRWNLLDFGLSKIRSQQLADETLIYEERRRKVILKIIGDVHDAYWRALSAQNLSRHLLDVEEGVQMAMENSETLYSLRETSPLAALSYQRELNDIHGQAQSLLSELSLNKVELAALIGLSPQQTFTLETMSFDENPQALAINFEQMIDLSLRQRPEVRETLYASRIGEKEMRKAVLETLPSLEGFAGLNLNSNDFLFHSSWADYGARASWNITKLFSLKRRKLKAKAKKKLDKQRSLAAASAVITQVVIARSVYENTSAKYLAAKKAAQIQADIFSQVEALSKAGSASRQTVIKERMKSLMSEARKDILQAELKQAAAHIYASIGADPYGADINGNEDVAIIAASLQAHWEARKPRPSDDAEISAQAATRVLRNKYDNQT